MGRRSVAQPTAADIAGSPQRPRVNRLADPDMSENSLTRWKTGLWQPNNRQRERSAPHTRLQHRTITPDHAQSADQERYSVNNPG